MNTGKIIFLMIATVVGASGQVTNSQIFPTLQIGKNQIVTNAYVSSASPAGIIIRFDGGGARVKFEDLPDFLRSKYKDLELESNRLAQQRADQIQKAEQERSARLKAQAAERSAKAKAERVDAIAEGLNYASPIHDYDFPQTEQAQKTCKEILIELKGINTAIELSISFSKYSDLLTDKVLAIEKIKELRGDGVPKEFLSHVESCILAYKTAKHWWNEKIYENYVELRSYDEVLLHEYWAIADIELAKCIGLAEKDTTVNAKVIGLTAALIKSKQEAVKAGILRAQYFGDPSVANLTVEQIAARLKFAQTNSQSMASTLPTNSPVTNAASTK